MKKSKLAHRNHLSWDVGTIDVEVRGRKRRAVVVVENDERRFFPVPRAIPWEEVVVHALEGRFAAVGWWGIPRQLRVELPSLVNVIRSSHTLDDTEIVVVDALISMRWARAAAEKILAGTRASDEEYLLVA